MLRVLLALALSWAPTGEPTTHSIHYGFLTGRNSPRVASLVGALRSTTLHPLCTGDKANLWPEGPPTSVTYFDLGNHLGPRPASLPSALWLQDVPSLNTTWQDPLGPFWPSSPYSTKMTPWTSATYFDVCFTSPPSSAPRDVAQSLYDRFVPRSPRPRMRQPSIVEEVWLYWADKHCFNPHQSLAAGTTAGISCVYAVIIRSSTILSAMFMVVLIRNATPFTTGSLASFRQAGLMQPMLPGMTRSAPGLNTRSTSFGDPLVIALAALYLRRAAIIASRHMCGPSNAHSSASWNLAPLLH